MSKLNDIHNLTTHNRYKTERRMHILLKLTRLTLTEVEW